jgi:hypothetical protein
MYLAVIANLLSGEFMVYVPFVCSVGFLYRASITYYPNRLRIVCVLFLAFPLRVQRIESGGHTSSGTAEIIIDKANAIILMMNHIVRNI